MKRNFIYPPVFGVLVVFFLDIVIRNSSEPNPDSSCEVGTIRVSSANLKMYVCVKTSGSDNWLEVVLTQI